MRVFDIGGGDEPVAPSDRIWTVPNVLSFLRLAVLPVIYVDLVAGRWLRSFVLLAVFSATDWLDGYLARRFDQVTRLGQLLDPISDRLLLVVVGIGFIVAGILPWWVVALLLARDVVVVAVGVRLLAVGRQPPPVSRLGKTATFGLMWALPTFLLARIVGGDDPQPVLEALAWATLVVNGVLYYAAAVGYLLALRTDTPPA